MEMACGSTDCDLDLLLDCESVHSEDDETDNAAEAYGITNLITFMHSYAAEPEAGSETDTGSDTEDGSKPDTVSSPSCYAMPTAIVRNSKNLECQNKNKTDSRQQLMVNDEKNSVGSEMVTNQTDKQTAIKRLPVTRQLESVSKKKEISRETAYTLFGKANRQTAIKQYGLANNDFSKISKKIGEMWQQLSRQEAERWKQRAKTNNRQRNKNKNSSNSESKSCYDYSNEQWPKCGHHKLRKSCFVCVRFMAKQESITTKDVAEQQNVTSEVAEQQTVKPVISKQQSEKKQKSLDTVVKNSSSNSGCENSSAAIPEKQTAHEEVELEMSCDQICDEPTVTVVANTSSSRKKTTVHVSGAEKQQVSDTTQPPAATSNQPPDSARPPAATSNQPPDSARPPAATSNQPPVSARPPAATSNQPPDSARQPAANSGLPPDTTPRPTVTSSQPSVNIVMKDLSGNAHIQQLLSKYIELKDGSKNSVNEPKIYLVARTQTSNDTKDQEVTIEEKIKDVKRRTSDHTLTDKCLKNFDDRWKCGRNVEKIDDFENQLKKCVTPPNSEDKVKKKENLEDKSAVPQKKSEHFRKRVEIENCLYNFENRWKCKAKFEETDDFENSLKICVNLSKSENKTKTEDLDDKSEIHHKRSERLQRKAENQKLEPEKKLKKKKDKVISKRVRKRNQYFKRNTRRCEKCKACLRERDCRKCDYCKDMTKYGGSGIHKQKCRLRQCEKWVHDKFLKRAIKTLKDAGHNSEGPVTRTVKVKECKSRDPGMKILQVYTQMSDKPGIKVFKETRHKSADSKTKHFKVTEHNHDKAEKKILEVTNYDLENPRRSNRLKNKSFLGCSNRWKEMREKNEDRKKRSDLLRRKLKNQRQMLQENQKKTGSLVNKSEVIDLQVRNDKATNFKNRKTFSDKIEDIQELRGRTRNIENQQKRRKEKIRENVGNKSTEIDANKSLTMMQTHDSAHGTEKQSTEKHDMLDLTDAVLSEHHKKLESQKAVVKQHVYLGPLKWGRRKGKRCENCSGCRRQTNCGKCKHCKDMRQFGGPGTKKQKCRLRQCMKTSKKIKKSSKGSENSDQASHNQNVKEPELVKHDLETSKQSEHLKTSKTKPDKVLEEFEMKNKDRKKRSEELKKFDVQHLKQKQQSINTQFGIQEKKQAVWNKYDPVRAKVKLYTKKLNENKPGMQKKNTAEVDKCEIPVHNKDSGKPKRESSYNLREAKISNFKALFRDPFKKSEPTQKVVPRQSDKLGHKDKTFTKTVGQQPLNTEPIATKITTIDPQSVIQKLTDDDSCNKAKRMKRRCEKCAACQRKDDCAMCRFCLDKVYFGGPGVLKQKCQLRQCEKLSVWKRSMRVQKEPGCQREPDTLSSQKGNVAHSARMTDETEGKVKVERDFEMDAKVNDTVCLPWSINAVGLYTPGGVDEKSIFIPKVDVVEKENDKTIEPPSGAYLATKVAVLTPPSMLGSEKLAALSKRRNFETVMNTGENIDVSVTGSSQVDDPEVKSKSYYNTSEVTNLIKRTLHEKIAMVTNKCGCVVMMNISAGREIGFPRQSCSGKCDWSKSLDKNLDSTKVPSTKTFIKKEPPVKEMDFDIQKQMYAEKSTCHQHHTAVPVDIQKQMYTEKSTYHTAVPVDIQKQMYTEKSTYHQHDTAVPVDIQKQMYAEKSTCHQHHTAVPVVHHTAISKKKGKQEKGKPLTSFILFSMTMRKSLLLENPQLEFCDISKRVGEKWRNLSPEERLQWKMEAQRQHKQAQQCDRSQQEFEIEMINDSVENVTGIKDSNSNRTVNSSHTEALDDAFNGYVELASWQIRDRSLSSDSAGVCAIDSDRTKLKQISEGYLLPSSEIKTEPMDEGDSFPRVCDTEMPRNVHGNQGTCKNLEVQNFATGRNSGTHEFENEWLRQNNIVIKKEPKEECLEPESRISVSESPMEVCHRLGVSDETVGPKEFVADSSRLNNDHSSVQRSSQLLTDSLADPVEIKSEPPDRDYGVT